MVVNTLIVVGRERVAPLVLRVLDFNVGVRPSRDLAGGEVREVVVHVAFAFAEVATNPTQDGQQRTRADAWHLHSKTMVNIEKSGTKAA